MIQIIKMRFTDKTAFFYHFINIPPFHIVYRESYIINQDGDLLHICDIQYNGMNYNIHIEIIED